MSLGDTKYDPSITCNFIKPTELSLRTSSFKDRWFLNGLSAAQVKSIKAYMTSEVYAVGSVILHEQMTSSAFFVVKSGQIEVRKVTEIEGDMNDGGYSETPVCKLEKNDFFGETCLFLPGKYPIKLIVTKKAKILKLASEAFLGFLKQNSAISNHLTQVFTGRLIDLKETLGKVSNLTFFIPGSIATEYSDTSLNNRRYLFDAILANINLIFLDRYEGIKSIVELTKLFMQETVQPTKKSWEFKTPLTTKENIYMQLAILFCEDEARKDYDNLFKKFNIPVVINIEETIIYMLGFAAKSIGKITIDELPALLVIAKKMALMSLTVFKDVDIEVLHTLAKKKKLSFFMINNEELLFEKGSKSDCFYIVYKGKLGVLNKQGEVAVQLGFGESCGELGVLADKDRSASVKALEESTLLLVTKKQYQQITTKYPQVSWHMMQRTAQKVVKCEKGL